MLALIAAIFTTSLLGSMHCAGMCGAFIAFAVGSGGDKADARSSIPSSRTALTAAYNIGRLVTYVCLGAAAGGLGAALDLGGSMLGLQRTAAILAGALMIGFGIVTVLRLRGARIARLPLPAFLTSFAKAAHARAFDLPPLARAASVGLLTTLLPCGWLYAFVIAAAGTGGPALGALTMAVFWAGTLPVVVTLGMGIQALTGPLRRHLPLATAILLVVVGTYTVAARAMTPALALPQNRPSSVEEALRSLGTDAKEAGETCPFCKDQHGR